MCVCVCACACVRAYVCADLLEKSRIIQQAADERTFHFCYQMLAGAEDDMKSKNFLKPPTLVSGSASICIIHCIIFLV